MKAINKFMDRFYGMDLKEYCNNSLFLTLFTVSSILFMFTKNIIIDKTYNGDVEFLISLFILLISATGVFWLLGFKLTSYFVIYGCLWMFGLLSKSLHLGVFTVYFLISTFFMQLIYWICESLDKVKIEKKKKEKDSKIKWRK